MLMTSTSRSICGDSQPRSGTCKRKRRKSDCERTASLTVNAPHRYWRLAFRYGSWESLDVHELEMPAKGGGREEEDVLNHEFVDALGFEGICHRLRDEDSQHDRHGICEGVRQLEHDLGQRNRRSRDARQRGCCANHCV